MVQTDDPRLTPPPGAPALYQVSVASAAIQSAPQSDASMVTQSLHGEALQVYAQTGGWGHVRCMRDGYVGWAHMANLAEPALRMTHKVSAQASYAYAKPDLKSAPQVKLCRGAQVSGGEEAGDYVLCARAGWMHKRHLAALDAFKDDPASVAEQYLHAPYLWGGRSASGLDCTGLTQQAFEACGAILPRDSDMQFAWVGEAIEDWRSAGALQRNDLIFWKGHVGIMLDSEILLHANAHHMAVATEPLSQAIPRIASYYAEPIGARRIDIAALKGKRPDWL